MMTVIGKHEQYREVKLVPAHLCCKIVCTETARCEHCQDPETGNDVLVQVKTPQPLFPHSYLSSSVIAEVLFEKFGLAVPFTRQTQYWERLGLPITSKHMARGVIEAGERFGQKIYERLRQEIKAAPVVQLDETPFQVLDLDQSHGYFWSACSTEEFSPHQVSYFHYAPSRSGKVITEILGDDFLAVLCVMGLVDILIIAYQKRIGGPVWFISIANLSDCLIQRLPAFKGKVLRVTLCGSLPKYFTSKNG